MTQFNGAVVGLVLKELIRRAIVIARKNRLSFTAFSKEGYDGNLDDVFTSVDTEAQGSFVKVLQECFPEVGIIAEEDGLVIVDQPGMDAYFTIDPLDGTKAYKRRQSHGVGSMVALVQGGQVISAYVGDVNTVETFGYRPDSARVWRISDLDLHEQLENNPAPTPVGTRAILLRERESSYGPLARRTCDVFKKVQIDGASIGTWAARLWKNEVGALLMDPSWETPWDSTPIFGISQKLGYVFLRPDETGKCWVAYDPVLPREKYRRDHDTLIIHRNNLESLQFALAN